MSEFVLSKAECCLSCRASGPLRSALSRHHFWLALSYWTLLETWKSWGYDGKTIRDCMFSMCHKIGWVRFSGLKAAGWKQMWTTQSENLASCGWSAPPSGVVNHPHGDVSLHQPWSDPKCDTQLSLSQLDPDLPVGAAVWDRTQRAGWKGSGDISTTKLWWGISRSLNYLCGSCGWWGEMCAPRM